MKELYLIVYLEGVWVFSPCVASLRPACGGTTVRYSCKLALVEVERASLRLELDGEGVGALGFGSATAVVSSMELLLPYHLRAI